MAEVALITEDLFKSNSPVTIDTNITDFVPYILIAQRMYIIPILGRPLVQELQEQIKAAQIIPTPVPYPITPANQALLVELAPVLSFYAVYQGLPFHWAAIVNKGITIRESENSAGISVNDLAQLRRWLKDDAEEQGRMLVEYLCGCAATYPLWRPGNGYGCGGDCGDGSKTSPWDAGIYIPNRR